MSTGVAGYPGYVRITGTPDVKVKGINSIDMPLQADTDETTAFDSDSPGYKTAIPTLIGQTIKLSGKRIPGDAGQNALRTAFFGRSLVTGLKVSPDGTEIHTVSVWVTSWGPKSDVKSAESLDIALLVEGDASNIA
jgi:hypothetical protein